MIIKIELVFTTILFLDCTVCLSNEYFTHNGLDKNFNGVLRPIKFQEQTEPYLPNVFTSVTECSLRHYKWGRKQLVGPVGGVEVFLREFPHLAAIGWTRNGTTIWNCGGSLITVNFVVTAAHCTFWEGQRPNLVRLGDLNLNSVHDDKYAQERDIVEVIRHPEYKSSSTYNDIALLRLNSPVTIHDTVLPVCLWPTFDFNFETMQAAGWGHTSYNGNRAEKLLKVVLNAVPTEDCKESYPKNKRSHKDGLIESQMCAMSKGEVAMDTCQGDSGGPLEIKLYFQARMIPFLVGITSFAIGCASGIPAVYTRVSSYTKWIENVTQETFDPIECALRNTKLRIFEPSISEYISKYDDGTGNFDSSYIFWDSTEIYLDRYDMLTKKFITIAYTVELTSMTTNKDLVCEGSIIDEYFILTSASCIKKFLNGPDAVIFKTDINSASANETFGVRQVFVHPMYDNTYNDIALVQLTEKIRYSNEILRRLSIQSTETFVRTCTGTCVKILFNQEGQIACIGSNYQLPDRVDAVGYGQQNINLFGERLDGIKHMVIKFNVTDAMTCSEKVRKVFKTFKGVQDSQLCAGLPYFTVPKTCETVIGGPLQRQLWDLSRYFPFVFGVNSIGADCGFGTPLVTTRVASFIPWIDSIVYPNPGNSGQKKPELEEQFQSCITENLKFRSLHAQYKNDKNFQQDQTKFSTMAMVEHYSGETKNPTWSCDAVIIHQKFVITTAGCATATKLAKVVVVVRIAKEPITLGLVRTHVHPEYDPENGENDVALLETESYITFDENVSPACLWYNQTHLPMFLSKPAISGNPLASTGNVNHINMFAISNLDCAEDHRSLTAAHFCTLPDFECKYALAKDFCSSKSCMQVHGGALMSFEIHQQRLTPTLVGFTVSKNYCNLEKPLIHVRISVYRDWIEQVLNLFGEVLVFHE